MGQIAPFQSHFLEMGAAHSAWCLHRIRKDTLAIFREFRPPNQKNGTTPLWASQGRPNKHKKTTAPSTCTQLVNFTGGRLALVVERL